MMVPACLLRADETETFRRLQSSFPMADRRKQAEETDRKASTNMMRYVVAIFVIALLLAAVWFFLFTPGDPTAVAG